MLAGKLWVVTTLNISDLLHTR